MTILIKNGLIVTGENVFPGDIFIKNGKIAEIAAGITKVAEEVVDASGKYILPGGVDPAVHLSQEVYNTITADDFETGSKAALFGGTTTILTFLPQSAGSFKKDLIEIMNKTTGKCAVDFGFHLLLSKYNDRLLNEISSIIKKGITSFACCFAGGTQLLNDGQLYKFFKAIANEKAIVTIHPGNVYISEVLGKEVMKGRKRGPRMYSTCNPVNLEALSIQNVVSIAEMTKVSLVILHLSCAHSIEKIKIARDRNLNVYGETCPHYITLTENKLPHQGFEGAKYICNPPLREGWHNEALWKGIQSGDIQIVSSDHMPFKFNGQKSIGKRDFRKIPPGLPGVEHRLLLLYSEGVRKGRISLTKLVQLTSTNPAKLFGLYPSKGTLFPGSDADLVLIDPVSQTKISSETHHMNVDYNPYEGMLLQGAINDVFLRGQHLIKDGKYMEDAPTGRFVERALPSMI